MQKSVDEFIAMNQAGLVLELCEKYYDENVTMLNNGAPFAESMRESYDKKKGFVDSIKAFDVRLLSSVITGDIAELTFHYKMTGSDAKLIEFTGKHVQTLKNKKLSGKSIFPLSDRS